MSPEFEESKSRELGLENLDPRELLNENQNLKEIIKDKAFKVTFKQESSVQGPLPPPEVLREYEVIFPGFTKHLLSHMDKEQAFRHTTISESQKESKRLNTASIWLAFTAPAVTLAISVLALVLGFLLIKGGDDASGLAALIVGLGTFAGIVIKSLLTKNEKEKDRQEGDSGPAGS